jgi:hypothetical protein
VTEARQAGKQCDKAAARLLDSLQHQKSGAVIQVDFDRLETAAFDLERRVLAATDAAARCTKAGQSEDALGQLGCRAQTWLEYVHVNRAADPTQQLQNLRVLTQSSW